MLERCIESDASGDFEITASLTKLDAPPTPAFLDAHGKASAVAILSRPVGDGLRVVAYARDPSAFRESFGKDLAPLQVALATGVPVERVAAHLNVTVDVHDVSGRFADASSADAAKGVAYLFIMMLYLSILLNAQSIMTSVAEEKTSRIAELLVSTLDPAQLLAAKILAAAATGFIQLAVWVAAGAVSGRIAAAMFPQHDGGDEQHHDARRVRRVDAARSSRSSRSSSSGSRSTACSTRPRRR